MIDAYRAPILPAGLGSDPAVRSSPSAGGALI